MKPAKKTEVGIHHAFDREAPIKPNHFPAYSKLVIFQQRSLSGLTFDVSKNTLACYFVATNAFDIKLFWQDHVHTFGYPVDSADPIPRILYQNKAYIRQELLAILRKLCYRTSLLTMDDRHRKPSWKQRVLTIKGLNYQIILALCQILAIPLTSLPAPIYQLCIINNL